MNLDSIYCRELGHALLLALLVSAMSAASTVLADEAAPASANVAAPSAPETASEDVVEEEPPPEPITDAKPLSPQPKADELLPGLSVNYFYKKFYTLSEVAEAEDGEPGESLANLDHITEDGKVLGADQRIMVGALIDGLMHFPEAGTYVLRVNSNDGVSVMIGGELVWIDPDVHYHRSSPPLEFVVSDPGWYEFAVDYFQKKGGSALQLFWTAPAGTETIVPPEVFSHLK